MKAYLEPEEVSLLEREATNQRDRLLIHVLFHTGCRVGEVVALKVEDIDLVQSTITIGHLKRRIHLSCSNCGGRIGASHIFCPKCGRMLGETQAEQEEHHRQRIVPVDDETMKMIEDYVHKGGPVLRNGRRLIFGINRHRAWQIIRDCALKAGLPKVITPETGKYHYISPHRLRDAFAVHAIKFDSSNDGLRLLQEHLGHASFNTTARYRKVSGEEHQDWYRKLWEKDTS
jgi:integrase/recombinase XerD